jgi:hypothetical protein
MAQRKPSSGGKPAAKKGATRPAGKPGATSTGKVSTAKSGAAAAAAARKKPAVKPGKSIVNQKQTPWGTIATVAAVVAFAAAVVIVVIVTKKSDGDNSDRYKLPELAQAKAIRGVVYKVEPNHNHVDGTVKYDTTQPTGGNHNSFYADCDGTVYTAPIASENAVHPMEHGAVWVTYREGLDQADVDKLASLVRGQDHVFMSPYPKLDSTVSLQAWNYQLKVDSVTDPRIAQFIATLAANPKITPELSGGAAAPCTNASFAAAPSTFGNPISAPQAPSSSSAPPAATSSGAESTPAGSTEGGSSAP